MIIIAIIFWIIIGGAALGTIITLVKAFRDWWRGDKFDGGSIMPFH